MTQNIPFIDLQAQRRHLGKNIDQAIARVLEHGAYIMGPEIRELEAKLAQFAGTKHALSCASGTDALTLMLMGWEIGPGDAVLVPSFTFVATAEVVALAGATPVFVDVLPDTFNMDPASLEAGVALAKAQGLDPKVVVPVDLFGQPADYPRIGEIADRHGMKVLSDTAQGFGGSLQGRRTGSWGDGAATSFFPAKPLGCYGDGGAVFTDDDETAQRIVSVRVHGQGSDKYDNVRIGVNGRLDTMQAAILLQKLSVFEEEIESRNRIAARYNEALRDVAVVPHVMDGATSVWAQYTILIDNRDQVAAKLKEQGIPTAVYYPIPLHKQTGYKGYPVLEGGLPVSENLAGRVLSLPMHPYLEPETQDKIVDAVKAATA